MNGYLIAEEGPLAGTTIVFEGDNEGAEWVLGRDPDTATVLLEDPMVSRRHAIIRLTPEGFIFENLSTVNPATQNGMLIAEPVLLKEGDTLQIGSTFFNFTKKPPIATPKRPSFEEGEPIREAAAVPSSEIHFGPNPETRWLLKVISGPNAGAEFAMHKGSTYLIGKDPNICDIVFQDLSVSRQHARLTIDSQDNVFIEDLGSRNGVIVNGELISDKHLLASQDLVALGTTTFLIVDRHEARETIISPSMQMPSFARPEEALAKTEAKERKNWKEMVIPKKHLVFAGVFLATLFTSLFAVISLFKSEPVIVKHVDEALQIRETLAKFSDVQFSFNQPSGKLFLVGHVLTTIDHQELLYLLGQMPNVREIEDNVVVDEGVWQNMNALLNNNPNWVGVSMYSPEPGKFVLRGYLPTQEDAVLLNDYIHLNFDYLERLENQVVVEKTLQTEIGSLLVEKGLTTVAFELSNGEVILSGRVDKRHILSLENVVATFKHLPGIRLVKNYVMVTNEDTSLVDVSTNYTVTGYSKRDEKDYFVVINGRILGQGDLLDGMLITKINPKLVMLEKEGISYKINYNLQ